MYTTTTTLSVGDLVLLLPTSAQRVSHFTIRHMNVLYSLWLCFTPKHTA